MASVDIIQLGWEDYPQPKIISQQSVFFVKINIPRKIRHLFGTEKGTSTDKKSRLVQPILPLPIKKNGQ